MMTASNRSYSTSLDAFSFTHGAQGIEEWSLRGNGLRVLLAPNNLAPVVSVMVQYGVGSANEAPGATGYTHLLEHMMFKASYNPNTGEPVCPDEILKPLGAEQNASTGKDSTNYYTLAPDDSLEVILELEALRMRNLIISEGELATELKVVLNELATRENMPHNLLYQAICDQAFGAHPYRHPVIGSITDLQSVSVEALKHFYDQFYHPDNAVIIIIGNFEIASALESVNRYFGKIPRGTKPGRCTGATEQPPQTGELRFTIQQANIEAPAQMMIAYRVPPAVHADAHALTALEHILGGSSSSRLPKRLVDKGLAAQVSVDFVDGKCAGLFLIHVVPSETSTLQEVERSILDEIDSLTVTGITNEELQRMCSSHVKAVALSREDPFALSRMLADSEAVASWIRFVKYGSELTKLTPTDIQRVGSAHLTQSNRTIGILEKGGDARPSVARPDPQKYLYRTAGYTLNTFQPAGVQGAGQARRWRGSSPPQLSNLSRHKLRNGMDVVFYPALGSGTVAVHGKIRAGAALNPSHKRAVAALVAGMLTRGCTGLRKHDIGALLEEMAIDLNFRAGSYQVEFGASVHPDDLSKFLSLVSRTLATPTFDPAEFRLMKARAITSIAQLNSNTKARARQALMSLVYEPASVNFIMSAEETLSMMHDLTVEDLVSFYSRFITPANMVLSLAGDIGNHINLVEESFSGWWGCGGRCQYPDEPMPTATGTRRLNIVMPGKQSATCLLGHASNLHESPEDLLPALIASSILGRDPLSSRLGTKVRKEKGYSYGITAGFADPYYGPAPYLVQFSANSADVEPALLETQHVLERFVEDGVTEEELEREILRTRGARKVSLRTTSGIARLLAHYAFLGQDLTLLGEFDKRLSSVTLEKVNEALRRYIRPGDMAIAVAGSNLVN